MIKGLATGTNDLTLRDSGLPDGKRLVGETKKKLRACDDVTRKRGVAKQI